MDWRSTMALYKETIGRRADADLTIKTLPSCNHNMLQCRTCGVSEDRETTGPREPCAGYQDAIMTWIKERDSKRPAPH